MTSPLQKSVRVLITGGTFDKVHNWKEENLDFLDSHGTQVPRALEEGRCFFPVVETLFQMDSLDMTDGHRAVLATHIENAGEGAIVVTHGTGTMEHTARYLAGKNLAKTVVLTGAMRPHSLYISDAGFNLGGAIIAAQTLSRGVYGVMNGRVFEAKDLQKNTEAGRFDM
ncbi:MAG: asparaginase domain-containing protein [Pseudomonadota bacterium]